MRVSMGVSSVTIAMRLIRCLWRNLVARDTVPDAKLADDRDPATLWTPHASYVHAKAFAGSVRFYMLTIVLCFSVCTQASYVHMYFHPSTHLKRCGDRYGGEAEPTVVNFINLSYSYAVSELDFRGFRLRRIPELKRNNVP